MKKNYIALMALLISPALCAFSFTGKHTAADKLIEFKKMESNHKSDWLNFSDKNHSKKMKMINHQHKDWTEFGIHKINQLKNSSHNDAVFAESLSKAIALHKKHKGQWKQWSFEMAKEAKDLAAKHDHELDAFEKSIQK